MSDLPVTPQPSCGSRHRFTKIILGAVALTALILSIALVLPDRAKAATHPGGDIQNPVIRNVDIARPAVVRIETAFSSVTVSLHFCASENDSFAAPPVGGLGSGAFISSHGDILTAGHVVKAPPGDLEDFELTLPTVDAQIVKLVAAHCHQTLDGSTLANDYLTDPTLQTDIVFTFASPIDKVWLDTSYVGSYSATSVRDVKYYPYTVEGLINFVNSNGGIGDDVSVIHVDGLTDMPSIPIGDSDAVSPTDTLTIIGYPGNGDSNHYTQGQPAAIPNDFLTESINQVYVSAIKTNDSNGKLIQVGGNVEHGDSGGPALNAAGEIVGVVSFGGTDQPDGTSFLQAVSNAKQIIQQANIDTTPGPFENKWRQALTDFGSTAPGHWHKAVTELKDIQTNYPNFKGADDYLTYAEEQAQNESTSTLNNPSALAGIGLAALAGVALLAIIIAVVAGRRRKPQAAVAVAAPVSASYTPQTAYPPSAPQSYSASGYPPSAPQGYSPPPPASPYGGQQMSGPASDVAPSAPAQAVCVNGHPMQPNEIYCRTCGAPRRQ